jgi:hypothetical protein
MQNRGGRFGSAGRRVDREKINRQYRLAIMGRQAGVRAGYA